MAEAEIEQSAGFDPRNLRVSDGEREHVVGLLQKAIGRGMLDLEEFTQRTDIALAARTRGELNAVLTDLPGLVHRDAAPQVVQYAGAVVGERLELRGHMSTINRSGPWVVPSHVLVQNKYGHTKLDFTEAQLTSPVVHIELQNKWGSVELIVPEQAGVDVSAITEVKYGEIDDKRATGATGSPMFVLTGKVHGGALKLRNPRRGIFG
nr:DUF1707 domain-containing protein [Amycolatopsis suaedae]